MLHPKIQRLADAHALIATLEGEITQELASLHSQYGFESVDIFIAAVKSASRGKGKRGLRGGLKGAKPKIRKRAKITDATRGQVKKLVKAGRTGSQIAKALKISLPSVQNIKKALGLVKSSKKPSRNVKARRVPGKKSAAPRTQKKRVTRKKLAAPKMTTSPAPAEPAVGAST